MRSNSLRYKLYSNWKNSIRSWSWYAASIFTVIDQVLIETFFSTVEYPPQNYVPSDLDHLFASYTQLPAGLRPDFISLDGGRSFRVAKTFDSSLIHSLSSLASLNFTYDSFANNGESNLDLTYAIGLAYPLPVTLYEAGTPDNSASFNNLLDAIDKSFCLYLGGDDPNYG